MEMILVELATGMALMAAAAVMLPLSARWLEGDAIRLQAFFVPSLLSIGITVLFAVGISLLVAAATMAQGNVGWIVLGIGTVGSVLLVKFGWKLLRAPRGTGKIGVAPAAS